VHAHDLRSPVSANLSMNRTPRAWFAPVKDPTSSTSTVSWLEITSGSGPCSTKKQKPATATFVVSMGATLAPPRARGVQRGTRPGGPLWSRRRRSPQLDGLKSGQRRHRRRRQSARIARARAARARAARARAARARAARARAVRARAAKKQAQRPQRIPSPPSAARAEATPSTTTASIPAARAATTFSARSSTKTMSPAPIPCGASRATTASK